MAPMNELDRFRKVWDVEAGFTTKLLESLPDDQYDFRPDPGGRSLGELAWHLSEIEGYISYGITNGAVTFREAPPNLQRPREVRLLAPGIAGCTRKRWRGSRASPRPTSTGKFRLPTGG